MNDPRDRLVDMLLQELVGGVSPPDLRERIAARLSPARKTIRLPARSAAQSPSATATPRRRGTLRFLAAAAVIMLLAAAYAVLHAHRQQARHWPVVSAVRGDAVLEGLAGPLRPGMALAPGMVLSAGDGGTVELAYNDGSRIILRDGGVVSVSRSGLWARAKALSLQCGHMEATVTVQPPGHPLVIESRHARITVVGTRFRVRTDEERTRLEVEQGVVRYLDRESRRFIDTPAGGYAESGSDLDLRFGSLGPEDPAGAPAVLGFTLMDADRDVPIPEHDPLADGAVLRLSALPTRNLNVRANTRPAVVGSVHFRIEGPAGGLAALPRYGRRGLVEEVWPYFLGGDEAAQGRVGDCKAWTPVPGRYRVTATPYEGPGLNGADGASAVVNVVVEP